MGGQALVFASDGYEDTPLGGAKPPQMPVFERHWEKSGTISVQQCCRAEITPVKDEVTAKIRVGQDVYHLPKAGYGEF